MVTTFIKKKQMLKNDYYRQIKLQFKKMLLIFNYKYNFVIPKFYYYILKQSYFNYLQASYINFVLLL